tara:strand:+ start:39 stop:656 length:618 start_codon:yes stop_codon:yes gene_type:complete
MIAKVNTIDSIRKTVGDLKIEQHRREEKMRESSVALILRNKSSNIEILFIKRASRIGDPWSGQMAFPGGHKEKSDKTLRQTAVRETFEEINLDLSSANYFGVLPEQRALARGKRINLIISPHVFYMKDDPVLCANHEVDEIIWSDLNRLILGACHDVETYRLSENEITCNGYRLEKGHFVWGLTYRMLKDFFSILDPNWNPPKEI